VTRAAPAHAAAVDIERIAPATLDAWRRTGEPVTVIDVRRRDTWAGDRRRIPGSVWIPVEELPRRARDLPPGARLVTYCT
jgi:rhodanese-related sulfurtransferase